MPKFESSIVPRPLSDLALGEQVGWIYETERQLDEVLHHLVTGALESNEQVLFVTHLNDPGPRISTRPDHPLFRTIEREQLRMVPSDRWLTQGGTFRADRVEGELERLTQDAITSGFSGVRLIFDMTWMFQVAGATDSLVAFESTLQRHLTAKRLLSLSCYYSPHFKSQFLHEALASYPVLLVDEMLYANIYYVPASDNGHTPLLSAAISDVLMRVKSFGGVEALLHEKSSRLDSSERALSMLEAIIDSMGDGVFVVNERGDMLLCNKSSERILGYGLLDVPFHERVRLIGNYLPPEGVIPYPPDELPIGRAMRGEAVDQSEIIIRNDRRPHGVWISVTARPLRGAQESIQGAVVVFRDITKQKHAEAERARFEEQMFRTQKLESLGVLAGGVAHDFNNLLMGVLGNADLALLDTAPHSPLRARVAQISTAARRLADLTNQLLAYSGQGGFVEGPIDLSEIVKEMAELLRPAVSKRASVRFEFAPNLPLIVGDATQIRQIIMNLITNASDALEDRAGVVAVSTGTIDAKLDFLSSTYLDEQLPEGRYVIFEVTDTGIGMSEETIAKIFDPFFTTKFTGRGLGLAAVLGIVRRHKGALMVESKVGSGSTFRVLFPISSEATELQEEAAKKASSESWRGSGLAMIIDDEEAVRDVGQALLTHAGFSVITASSGVEAIELFRTHAQELRLVILDMTMPDMNGEEVFLKLRRIPSPARVLLSSGYHELASVRRLSKAGVAGFLRKPYGTEGLLQAVRDALRTEDE